MAMNRNGISEFIINPLSSFHILLFISLISYFLRIIYKPQLTIVIHLILLIAVNCFWLGLIFAICFMENWTKFLAPSLTLSIGTDVGRHVFSVLNKCEIAVIIVLLNLLEMQWTDPSLQLPYNISDLETLNLSLLAPITLVGFLQTCWLLPSLLHKSQQIISTNQDSQFSFYSMFSNVTQHIYYATEFAKVSCIFYALKMLINSLVDYVQVIAKE